ncbi:unnamed protein product [Boreogadus saida]
MDRADILNSLQGPAQFRLLDEGQSQPLVPGFRPAASVKFPVSPEAVRVPAPEFPEFPVSPEADRVPAPESSPDCVAALLTCPAGSAVVQAALPSSPASILYVHLRSPAGIQAVLPSSPLSE